MAQITFATIDIPTPAPYDAANPLKNWGDLCYVILQMAKQAKDQGVTLNDQTLAEIKMAIHDYSLSVLAIANLRSY